MKDTTPNVTDSTTLPAHYKSFQRTSTPTNRTKPGKEDLHDPHYSAFLRHLHDVPRKMKTRGLLRETPDIISCNLLVRAKPKETPKDPKRSVRKKESVHIELSKKYVRGEWKETFHSGSKKELEGLHEMESLRRTSKARHIFDLLVSFGCGKELKAVGEGKAVRVKTKSAGLEDDFQIGEGGQVSYYATGCLCTVY